MRCLGDECTGRHLIRGAVHADGAIIQDHTGMRETIKADDGSCGPVANQTVSAEYTLDGQCGIQERTEATTPVVENALLAHGMSPFCFG